MARWEKPDNNMPAFRLADLDGHVWRLDKLKGKKVAIWPGSTQEAVILERLRMEGMSIRDIQLGAFGREWATSFEKQSSKSLYNPDFAMLARSFGVDAARVFTFGDSAGGHGH